MDRYDIALGREPDKEPLFKQEWLGAWADNSPDNTEFTLSHLEAMKRSLDCSGYLEGSTDRSEKSEFTLTDLEALKRTLDDVVRTRTRVVVPKDTFSDLPFGVIESQLLDPGEAIVISEEAMRSMYFEPIRHTFREESQRNGQEGEG